MDGISDDIVTEIKDSLQQLELDSSIQTYASKKEFKEVLSESSSGNQTIFCVIKKRKGDHDDRSSRSSPYVMFHSTKLFKVLFIYGICDEWFFLLFCFVYTLLKKSELTYGTFPVSAENRHSSKAILSTTDSVVDHHVKQSGKLNSA